MVFSFPANGIRYSDSEVSRVTEEVGTTPLTVWFNDPAGTDHALVGGKGANLGRLAGAGFPVPSGFVVTTGAYDAHIKRFSDEIVDALSRIDYDDAAALEMVVADIRRRIVAADMPFDVVTEIRAAYAALDEPYVAVRSSGTAEDLEGASFAGLHDTYLDIKGADEVLDAVKRDWASLWTARAVAYRKSLGFTELPSMAVVVQIMIPSEVAGVMFTGNPLNQASDQILLNANWGLGEAVVQGVTSPDQYVIEHKTWRVLERTLGGKDLEIVRDPEAGHGTVEREVEEARRQRFTLTDERVVELAELGARIQDFYGGAPQDIEWAYTDGRFHLLQARPVTGVSFGRATPAGASPSPQLATSPVHLPGRNARWTTANVDEGLPGTVTPLTWSLYFPATETTMRDCWVDLGVMPEAQRAVPEDVDTRFISVAYGHAIANVDTMGQMAARVPGGSAARMEEQLFGAVEGDTVEPTGLTKIGRYPIVAVKLPRAVRRAMKDLAPRAQEMTAWWERTAFALEHASLTEAVEALVEARARYESVLTVHMVLSMAAQGVMGQVESLAARAGLRGLERELIKSDEGTAEFELVRDLWRLSRDEIDVDHFVRAHGYHGPREGLVESIVWREDPAPVLELVKAYRMRAGGDDVDTLVARRRSEHQDAIRRLESALGPLRSIPARALIRFAAHVPIWRETGRACMLRAVDVARAASRVVGRHLAAEGLLDDASDVRFLTIDELAAMDRDSIRALVTQRRIDHQAYDAMTLPHVWRGVPGVQVGGREAPSNDAPIATLAGLGVSAGITEGTVRVMLSLDTTDIAEGTVMVCKATDPSWASLFPLARGVITDVGSALSHAAIVCRELGLPCVANTRTGTRDLRDGMRVRVNGTTGTVDVLDTP